MRTLISVRAAGRPRDGRPRRTRGAALGPRAARGWTSKAKRLVAGGPEKSRWPPANATMRSTGRPSAVPARPAVDDQRGAADRGVLHRARDPRARRGSPRPRPRGSRRRERQARAPRLLRRVADAQNGSSPAVRPETPKTRRRAPAACQSRSGTSARQPRSAGPGPERGGDRRPQVPRAGVVDEAGAGEGEDALDRPAGGRSNAHPVSRRTGPTAGARSTAPRTRVPM